jgi:16S rRNA (cytidine1402-2'-O)-methyltransferase
VLPVVIYEAPHRVLATLRELAALCGDDRPLLVARELTKVHEELMHVPISVAISKFEVTPPKGEFTLVIGPSGEGGGGGKGPEELEGITEQARSMLQVLLQEGVSASTASKAVAAALGLKKNQVKQLATLLVRQE